MPGETPSVSLHRELAELHVRAQRAINEARTLAADQDFIRWWYGMRGRSAKPAPLIDD